MVLLASLIAATLFLAYTNGANDNIKGVATLYGSGAATYRVALLLGTAATFAGCVASVFLADTLIKAFSGKGLVPAAVAAAPEFLTAVAAGAGATVLLATRFGFPISTTHALTGGLTGAGLVMAGSDLNLSALGTAFFLPLLISPLLAVVLTMPIYKLASVAVSRSGIKRESCVCVGPREFVAAEGGQMSGVGQAVLTGSGPTNRSMVPELTIGTAASCTTKYSGRVLGITAQSLVDSVHFASAAALSFARGLNDTPKIAGLLLTMQALDIKIGMIAIASAMALGGLLHAHRVAETMSLKISKMNDGQALTANLVTACLVIGASRLGMPVSTTHVSVGAISGIGIVNGSADRSVISSVLMSWVCTLPIAAGLAALVALTFALYN